MLRSFLNKRKQLLSGVLTLSKILAIVLTVAVLLSFILPLLITLVPIFNDSYVIREDATFPIVRIMMSLRFTLLQALLSSLLSVVIGIPAAAFIAKKKFLGRSFLMSLSGVPLCVPPAIIALAFVIFYGRQGYVNTLLMYIFSLSEPPITFLYSMMGLVLAHGFYNFPVVMRTVALVWERMKTDQQEAALLLGASPFRIFFTITLPHLGAPILSSSVLVFLYCFFSFIIVLLFGGIGGTTLEVELYQAFRNTLDLRTAGLIAALETVTALLIVFLYLRLEASVSHSTRSSGSLRFRTPIAGLAQRLSLSVFLSILFLFFIGPLVSIPLRSIGVTGSSFLSSDFAPSFAAWKQLFTRPIFFTSLLNTVMVGLVVACISTFVSLVVVCLGEYTKSKKRLSKIFAMLPLSPLAVSSVVLGFGWILLVPRGTAVTLVFAQASIAWPFAWIQVHSAFNKIPPIIHESAALLSKNFIDSVFRIYIPLVRRGLALGAGFVFAISAGDATLPLVLSIARFENLSLLLFRLAGSYRFAESCVVSLIIALISSIVFFFQEDKRKEKRYG